MKTLFKLVSFLAVAIVFLAFSVFIKKFMGESVSRNDGFFAQFGVPSALADVVGSSVESVESSQGQGCEQQGNDCH